MKNKGKFIGIFVCVLFLLFCCHDDNNMIEPDSDVVFTWNEEFWQDLQSDTDFIEVGKLLGEYKVAFHRFEENLLKFENGKKVVDMYIKTADSISKVIASHLLTLDKKYTQFSYEYYFKQVETTIASDSNDVTSRGSIDEVYVTGDCSLMQGYYATISSYIHRLKYLFNETYCLQCQREKNLEEKQVILNALSTHNVFVNREEFNIFYIKYEELDKAATGFSSCKNAQNLAELLYLRGGGIKMTAYRFSAYLSPLMTVPEYLFGIIPCPHKYQHSGGSGSDSGSGSGGEGGKDPLPPDVPIPGKYVAELSSNLISGVTEIGEEYNLLLNVYNTSVTAPAPIIKKVEYLVRRPGATSTSLQVKSTSTREDLFYTRKAIAFGRLEFLAEVYIEQQSSPIISEPVVIVERSPSIDKFKDLPVVQNMAVTLWNMAVEYAQAHKSNHEICEFGCFIYLDTGTGEYSCGGVIPGIPVVLDKSVEGTVKFEYDTQQYNPTEPLLLIVGTLHSHYPLTWAASGIYREPGPSDRDRDARLPGIVYDYTRRVEAGMKVDISNNPKRIYTYGSIRRDTP